MAMEDKREEFETRKENPESVEQAKENNEDAAVKEYINIVQRLQAEFENYKKRTEKEKQEIMQYGKALLLKELLTIVDTFEIAMKSIKNGKNKSLVQGFEMVYNELLKLLQKEGVSEIKSIGEKLDPFKHEVLMQKEGEEEGIILEVLQKGYMFNDKVLRASKVVVSKKKQAEVQNGN